MEEKGGGGREDLQIQLSVEKVSKIAKKNSDKLSVVITHLASLKMNLKYFPPFSNRLLKPLQLFRGFLPRLAKS